MSQSEVRKLELVLRPVAGGSEIQQTLVPLLDRVGLHGLAMAWDSEQGAVSDSWLRARFERWLALGAPEFAFLTLAQLQVRDAARAEDRARASALLAAERAVREPRFLSNLAALAQVDPELHQRLSSSARLSVGLRPVGAGLAEYAGPNGPPLQLWAATPSEAHAEAESLCTRCAGRSLWFIAGAGDGTLPAAALASGQNGVVHLVEAHLVRLRALFELVDMGAALRERRMRLHAGTTAVDSLYEVLAAQPLEPDSVVGGDALSLSLIEAAAARVANR